MYVINLDRTPERMRRFQQVNPHLTHVTRFPAVDGSTVTHAALLQKQIFTEPIFYSNGSIGNTLSHLQLWNMAAAKSASTTVFEDDAIVHKDFETLAPSMIAGLGSDWDVVLWGWNFDAVLSFDVFPGVPCLSHFSQADMRKQWDMIQKSPVCRPALHRLHYCFGTVAYSISPRGAEQLAALAVPIQPFLYKLPGHNLEVENLGIDCVLTKLYDRLDAFVCFPPLVLTKNEHAGSTVRENPLGQAFGRIRRLKQSLLAPSHRPRVESDFRLIPSADYPKSREYARKYAHYLYKNGDKIGAARKYLKHLFIRN
jgi:glycosyl transferase, family 25